MRIGGFYGFTVPMLMLVYDEQLEQIVKTFDARLNSRVASDLYQETWYFTKAVKNIKFDVKLRDNILAKHVTDVTISSGNVVGKYVNDSMDKDEAIAEILNGLMDAFAVRLYEKLQSGDSLDVSFLEDIDSFMPQLNKLVRSSIEGKSFSLDNLTSFLRTAMKSLKSPTPVGDYAVICNNIRICCNVYEDVPDKIYLDNKVLELSDDEKSVLLFYHNQIPQLESLYAAIPVGGFRSDTIFGLPFIDFLNRKPTSLYYMVTKQFDYIKNSDMKLLPTVLSNIASEFSKCITLIKEYLYEPDGGSSLYLTKDSFSEILSEPDGEAIEFINGIYDYLNDSNNQDNIINEDDLRKLERLFYNAKFLNLQGINSVWGTNFDYSSLQTAIDKFNQIGLGGINLLTSELYKHSMKEIIFTGSGKINKSPEYLEELTDICNNIQAFISTFKPIGGTLDV